MSNQLNLQISHLRLNLQCWFSHLSKRWQFCFLAIPVGTVKLIASQLSSAACAVHFIFRLKKNMQLSDSNQKMKTIIVCEYRLCE